MSSNTSPRLLRFRKSFLTGLVILLPIGVTAWLVAFLLDRVGETVRPLLVEVLGLVNLQLPQTETVNILLRIFAVAIVVFLITGIGVLSRFFIGRYFISLAEKIVDTLPFINSVYRTVKQIVDTFSKQERAVFQRCVLIEYPRKGCFALGFLTSDSRGEVQDKTGAHLLNVFVPTTPNPTSGFLLMVPQEDVTDMQMSISDGMKLIISGGAVVPPWNKEENNAEAVLLQNPEQTEAPSGKSR